MVDFWFLNKIFEWVIYFLKVIVRILGSIIVMENVIWILNERYVGVVFLNIVLLVLGMMVGVVGNVVVIILYVLKM